MACHARGFYICLADRIQDVGSGAVRFADVGIPELGYRDLNACKKIASEYSHAMTNRATWQRSPARSTLGEAEIDLSRPRRMRERHQDVAMRLLAGPYGVFHHRHAADVTALIPQPIEDSLGRMTLLRRRAAIGRRNLINLR